MSELMMPSRGPGEDREAAPYDVAPRQGQSVLRRWQFTHALLFTGHMIDIPGRKEPRFPAWAEERAFEAILKAIETMPWVQPGPTIGLAGAASGGDLLFHEACAVLGIPTRILLALPIDEFLAASVAPAGPDWVRRFHSLVDQRGPENLCMMGTQNGLLEGKTENVWQRANLWMIEDALELAPERSLLALWDGKPGDGPGGTGHLVRIAPQFGVRVAPLIQMQMLLKS
jgi:hypothetical protein